MKIEISGPPECAICGDRAQQSFNGRYACGRKQCLAAIRGAVALRALDDMREEVIEARVERDAACDEIAGLREAVTNILSALRCIERVGAGRRDFDDAVTAAYAALRRLP